MLIEGSNEAGKSSLFESVYFALYGASIAGSEAAEESNRLVRYGANFARVALTLAIDDTRVEVHRAIVPDKPGRAEVVVTRPGIDPESLTELAAVNARIIELLGGLDGDALLNSCFVEQGRGARLEDISGDQREQSIPRLLNLDRLSALETEFTVTAADEAALATATRRRELAEARHELATLEAERAHVDRLLKAIDVRHDLEELASQRQLAAEATAEQRRLEAERQVALDQLEAADRLRRSLDYVGEILSHWEAIVAGVDRVSRLREAIEILDKANAEDLPRLEARLDVLQRLALRAIDVEARQHRLAEIDRALWLRAQINDSRQRLDALRQQVPAFQTEIDRRRASMRSMLGVVVVVGLAGIVFTVLGMGATDPLARDLAAPGLVFVAGALIRAMQALRQQAAIQGHRLGLSWAEGRLAERALQLRALTAEPEPEDEPQPHVEPDEPLLTHVPAPSPRLRLGLAAFAGTASAALFVTGALVPAPVLLAPAGVLFVMAIALAALAGWHRDVAVTSAPSADAGAPEEPQADVSGDDLAAEASRLHASVAATLAQLEVEAAELDLPGDSPTIRRAVDRTRDEIDALRARIGTRTTIESEVKEHGRLATEHRSRVTELEAILTGLGIPDLPVPTGAVPMEYQPYRAEIRERLTYINEAMLHATVSTLDAAIAREEGREAAALECQLEIGGRARAGLVELGVVATADLTLSTIEAIARIVADAASALPDELAGRREELTARIADRARRREELERALPAPVGDLDLPTCQTEESSLRHALAVRRYATRIVTDSRQRIVTRALPRTERNLRRLLPLLTAGRYHDARIGPDFRVEVWDEWAGRYTGKAAFSAGARQQISLALRLGFALATLPDDLVTTPGFIFLDEPVTAFDAYRARALVALLTGGQIAANFRQVLVTAQADALSGADFTHRVRLEQGQVVESDLPAPAAPGSPGVRRQRLVRPPAGPMRRPGGAHRPRPGRSPETPEPQAGPASSSPDSL